MPFISDDQFSDITRNVGYIIAAGIAVRLGWLRRKGSKWLPDQEAVPMGYTAVLNFGDWGHTRHSVRSFQ